MMPDTQQKKHFIPSDYIILVGGAVAVVAAGIAYYAGWNSIIAFVTSAFPVSAGAPLHWPAEPKGPPTGCRR